MTSSQEKDPDKDPWRYHKSINQKSSYETDLDEYSPYVMGRSLSYHQNILVNAINVLNTCGWIDKELHYDFLFYGLPKEFRRVSKWARPQSYDEDDFNAVKEYYGYNNVRAAEVMRILTKSQLEEIRKRMEKG